MLAVLAVSWDDLSLGTSPFRFHIAILFMSLWEDEEETLRVVLFILNS